MLKRIPMGSFGTTSCACRVFVALLALCASGARVAGAADAELKNDRYLVRLADDGAVTVSAATGSASAVFRPTFSVLFTKSDPKVALRPADLGSVKYSVTTWKTGAKTKGDGIGTVDTTVTAGDGFDNAILK